MVHELAKSIREYKKSMILTPVFVVGEVIMEAIIPPSLEFLTIIF